MKTQIMLSNQEAQNLLTSYMRKDREWNHLPNLEVKIETCLLQKKVSIIRMARNFYEQVLISRGTEPSTINKPSLIETKEFVEKWIEQDSKGF